VLRRQIGEKLGKLKENSCAGHRVFEISARKRDMKERHTEDKRHAGDKVSWVLATHWPEVKSGHNGR